MSHAQQLGGLCDEARGVYKRIKREYSIVDTAGLVHLLGAMKSLDMVRAAEAVLATEGYTILDRWGQKKIHPMTQVLKESRAGLIAHLRALDLDLESLKTEGKK